MTRATRLCPRDGDLMTIFTVFGIDLDQCPTCRGIWFDTGELDRVKSKLENEIRWKDLDLRDYAARTRFRTSDMSCPECRTALAEFWFDDTHIRLEFCPACWGVWLDEGKLGRIISHVRRKTIREPMPEVERDALHQFLEIFIGPKGPWEEIRDFAAAWRLLTLRFAVDHPELVARLELARRALPF